MKSTLCAATLIALLAAGVAGAAEPSLGKFVRYEVGDITLMTTRGASQARAFMGDLAKSTDMEASWGFGATSLRMHKYLDLAQASLETAYEQAPTNALIAMELAELHDSGDEPEKAIPYLEDVIRFSTDLGVKHWPARRLAKLDEKVGQRKKSVEENGSRTPDDRRAKTEKKSGGTAR